MNATRKFSKFHPDKTDSTGSVTFELRLSDADEILISADADGYTSLADVPFQIGDKPEQTVVVSLSPDIGVNG